MIDIGGSSDFPDKCFLSFCSAAFLDQKPLLVMVLETWVV
jgi:hypothetical protein